MRFYYISWCIFFFTFALHGQFNIIEHQRRRTDQIFTAIENEDIRKIKRLLRLGCNINRANSLGITPLHKAVACDSLKVVSFLLRQPKIKVDVLSNDHTPLHRASIMPSQLSIIKKLISKGADVNAQVSYDGFTPLHIICDMHQSLVDKKSNDILHFLLKSQASQIIPNHKGDLPLHLAARNNNKKYMKKLIKKDNAGIYKTNRDQKYPDELLPDSSWKNYLVIHRMKRQIKAFDQTAQQKFSPDILIQITQYL